MKKADKHMSSSPKTTIWGAIASGLAGALVLTAVHESVRHLRHDAPRMDLLARRGLDRILQAVEVPRPDDRGMYVLTLIGDISSNALYYAALVLRPGAHVVRRAWLGGTMAGAAALVLPPRLGLGAPPREQRTSTRVMTVAWYTLGALAAAMTNRLLARRRGRNGVGTKLRRSRTSRVR